MSINLAQHTEIVLRRRIKIIQANTAKDRDLRCGSQSFVQVLHRTKPTVRIIVHFKDVHVALLRQLDE